MDKICLSKSFLTGKIAVCSSKSIAHRAIILGALCGRKITVKNVDNSKDIDATINALRSLNVKIDVTDRNVIVDGSEIIKNSDVEINANESGSTLRFMIPIAVALNNNVIFLGEGRLPKRPLDDYFTLFNKEKIRYEKGEDYLPLKLSGTFKNDTFEINGNTSSQFITGLMLAAIINERDITIIINNKIESKPYIDITVGILKEFGHFVSFEENIIKIRKGKCTLTEYTVEKDWSQAAFFLAGGVIGGDITLLDMNINSLQGDKKILELLKEFGGDITVSENGIRVKNSELKGIKIDASQIPDLVPILSVVGAMASGTTCIYNAGRLKLKESDRLFAVTNMLTNMGVSVKMGEDSLEITGKGYFDSGNVDSFNDHRIVMSAAIAALNSQEKLIINGYNAISKSYPGFFDDYFKIGGKGEYIK